jgi:uncharacterized protein (TIGR03067 family)
MPRWPATLLLVALAAVAPAAPAPKDRPATDPDLVGDWAFKALTQGGVAVRGHYTPPHTEFTAGGERVGRNRNGVIVSTERYCADRALAPRAIDLWGPADGAAVARGVYAIDGDTLTIVYVTDAAADRPTKVEAPAGSKVFQAVYERKHKD